MTPAAIAATVALALIISVLGLRLMRTLAHEMSRAPQATAFQQRYIRDSHERSQWQLFTIALGAGTLPQLQESLK